MGVAYTMYGERGVYTGFPYGNIKKRNHLLDRGIEGRIIIRWIFRKWDLGMLTALIWLRIGTDGGHL